jgi:predicted dehydrogenase
VEWVEAAARAGKHVLCEKSLASDTAGARRAVSACEASGVAFLEGFMYQFHVQHRLFDECYTEGLIGKAALFQAWFGFPPRPEDDIRYQAELGGGALLDAGAYTVHRARRFFGREPCRVAASLEPGFGGVDVHGAVLLDFGDGQTAQLAFGMDNAYRNSYEVWGQRGVLRLTRAFSLPSSLQPTLVIEGPDGVETRVLPADDHFLNEVEAFCAAVDDPDRLRRWRGDALAQASALESIRSAAGAVASTAARGIDGRTN